MLLKKREIQFIINTIKKHAKPNQIYLFGSYASGHPSPNSDLDLLIIKDRIKNKRKELIDLKKQLISKDFSLDILLYSSKEFQKKKKEGWRIFQDIEEKGKLYQC